MVWMDKFFGNDNDRFLKRAFMVVEEINVLEPDFKKLSNQELRIKTHEFKERLSKGETLDQILPEAFAAVREASIRTLGQRHFDVQLIGGIALHEGKIAEMKTGEGKTLTATLALYLNALEGNGAHVVTVNDYLARRDAVWMGQIYDVLGLTAGCLNHESSYLYDPGHGGEIQNSKFKIQNDPLRQSFSGASNSKSKIDQEDKERDIFGGFKVVREFLRPCTRKEAYRADITYGTNNEFGFDYLRDNLVYETNQSSQRIANEGGPSFATSSAKASEVKKASEGGWNFAIVDEVDSILIDEARTPLIISQPDAESGELYQKFAKIVPKLKSEEHYQQDEKMRSVVLTQAGISKVESLLGLKNLYEEGGFRLVHHLEQALKAYVLFKKDKDYIIKDGEVIIVDEFTGRLMPGRRYSEGLHQAIEAKENVAVKRESRTVATITFQNYFRLYKKLAGMSGTALTSAEEFHKVYNLEVAIMPTHKPMIRTDWPDAIYRSEKGKFQAVLRKVKELNEKGQPVLIGTSSIERNEYLGVLLNQIGVKHNILNAKNHEAEAQTIAQAGQLGAVTLATNIAGRGVDIVLGGNPPDLASAEKIKQLGGLFVLGTGRHEARRIDNQLRGRAGRQGDPGESQFFVSLEDDLMRVFGGDKIKSIMTRFNIPEDEAINSSLVSRAIEAAQAKIEGYHFDMRKHILEYDEVMNKHREVVYKMRREFIDLENGPAKTKEKILEMLQDESEHLVKSYISAQTSEVDFVEILNGLERILPLGEQKQILEKEIIALKNNQEQLTAYVNNFVIKAYQEKESQLGEQNMRQLEKLVLLRVIDELWMDHLEEMEYLRDSVGLRAYGQRDPLVEYKNEGHRMFQDFLGAFQQQVVGLIFKVSLAPQVAPVFQQPVFNRQTANAGGSETSAKSVGRNDPCPCGAKHADGRPMKYKHCHGK